MLIAVVQQNAEVTHNVQKVTLESAGCATLTRPRGKPVSAPLAMLDHALPILRRGTGAGAPAVRRPEALRAEIAGPPLTTAAQRRAVVPFL